MRYTLPSYDACSATGTSVAASVEDPDYTAENLIGDTPKPAKLTGTTGTFTVTLPSAATIIGVVLIDHNIDAALSCTIASGGGYSLALTIPAWREDGYSTNYYAATTPTSHATWILTIIGTNTNPVSIGRMLLLTTIGTFSPTFLAEPEPQIEESHGVLSMRTDLEVETVYPLVGPRRTVTAQFRTSAAQAALLQGMRRYVGGRAVSFVIWPFATDNEPMLVRYEEDAGTRIYHRVRQTVPFRVREVARTLPWP